MVFCSGYVDIIIAVVGGRASGGHSVCSLATLCRFIHSFLVAGFVVVVVVVVVVVDVDVACIFLVVVEGKVAG